MLVTFLLLWWNAWSKITFKMKSLFGLNGFRGRVCNGEVWQAARAGSWGNHIFNHKHKAGKVRTASEARLCSQSQLPGIYFLLKGPSFQGLLNFPQQYYHRGLGIQMPELKGGHFSFTPQVFERMTVFLDAYCTCQKDVWMSWFGAIFHSSCCPDLCAQWQKLEQRWH